MQNRGLRDKMHHGTRSGPAVHSRRERSRMGLPPESDSAALEGCMRTDTMVKWAMGIGALSVRPEEYSGEADEQNEGKRDAADPAASPRPLSR